MRKLLNQIIQWALREQDMKAMNGRILEVSTYKPNNHGPDWTNEMFIVPEDQTLTQALTTLLVLKGLNT
jgi:Mg/Co/Ni transporter MgtE